jgi:hypothetical protein
MVLSAPGCYTGFRESASPASPVAEGITSMDPLVLLFILLICALPLLIGFLIGRAMPALPRALTLLGSIAVGLPPLGLLLGVAGRVTQVNAGLSVIFLGVILTLVGFLCACFGCGLALGTAQRLGQQAWFVVLLFSALFPLVAALVLTLTIFVSAVPLVLVFTLIGAGAVLAYGALGQRAARPNP